MSSTSSSLRLLVISSVLVLMLVHVNGGYWVCDWVNGRGWMYCSGGYCNSYGKKRSLSTDDEQMGPVQNHDATYCLDTDFCYVCQSVNGRVCRITRQRRSFPISQFYARNRRGEEEVCP